MSSATPPKAKRSKGAIVGSVLLTLLILGLVAAAGFFYMRWQEERNDAVLSEKEVSVLVEKVGKLIKLPSDEQPTVATVQDTEKLVDQPFFKDAMNGDKLLVYSTAQKAIIYREEANMLINVGPVTIEAENEASATPSPAPSASPSATPRVSASPSPAAR